MKAYSGKERDELNERAKKEFNNHYDCDLYGRFPWCCEYTTGQEKRKGLRLSKSSLGEFTLQVMKCDGNITQLWKFSEETIFPIFWLTLDNYMVFYENTKYYISPCKQVKLN